MNIWRNLDCQIWQNTSKGLTTPSEVRARGLAKAKLPPVRRSSRAQYGRERTPRRVARSTVFPHLPSDSVLNRFADFGACSAAQRAPSEVRPGGVRGESGGSQSPPDLPTCALLRTQDCGSISSNTAERTVFGICSENFRRLLIVRKSIPSFDKKS